MPEYIEAFFSAGILGLTIAAPIGMDGLRVINRSLSQGQTAGLVVGMGAATAHSVWALCAIVFGSSMGLLISSQAFLIKIFAAILMLALGVKTFISKPKIRAKQIKKERRISLWRCYIMSLGISLTNPLSILPFIGLAAAGQTAAISIFTEALQITGVFFGSALWWLVLSSILAVIGSRLPLKLFRSLNYVSGTVMTGWGVTLLPIR